MGHPESTFVPPKWDTLFDLPRNTGTGEKTRATQVARPTLNAPPCPKTTRVSETALSELVCRAMALQILGQPNQYPSPRPPPPGHQPYP